MNKELMREGKFHLITEVPRVCGVVKCLDRWYVSDEYGHRIKEVRAVHSNKLYYIAISEFKNSGKVLPINVSLIQESADTLKIQGFGASVPSAGYSLDINNLSSYRDMINRTIKFLGMLNKYYKGDM